ncbi:hypothetical protein BH09BAC6_BH09BAC6_26530 [soil metagenome]|jgi:hypothetical protein
MPVQLTNDPQVNGISLRMDSLSNSINLTNGSQFKSASHNPSVQVDISDAELLQQGEGDVILGLIVNRNVIKEMVRTYRFNHSPNDPDCVKFIHFNLREVLELFIKNEVINPDASINSQLDTVQYCGFKIYMGNHYNIDTCPQMAATVPAGTANPYLHKDTAIICNTYLDPLTGTWKDKFAAAPTGDYVSVASAGEGLDRGSLCPPNCPGTPDPLGYKYEDILP